MSPRPGRRPMGQDTRTQILEAARRQFGRLGYRAVTLRDVAREAGVDPALVSHYFESKERLFEVALELPLQAEEILGRLRQGEPAEAGERILGLFLELWEGPASREPLMVMLRSALTNERARDLLRGFLFEGVVAPAAALIGGEEAELRATLVGGHLLGLAVVRYLIEVEPVASATPSQLLRLVAPALQRYLAGPGATA